MTSAAAILTNLSPEERKSFQISTYDIDGDSIEEILSRQILNMLAVIAKHEDDANYPNNVQKYLDKYKLIVKE